MRRPSAWPAVLLITALVLAASPAAAQPSEAVLEEGAGFSAKDFPRVLTLTEPRLRGPDVRSLQAILCDGGYLDGPIDGIFGPRTAEALALFQTTHGLMATRNLDRATLEEVLAFGRPVEAATKTRVSWTPKPKPASDDIRLVVDTDALSLTVLVDGEPYQQYPVAVGRPSLPTPHGDFTIKAKEIWGGGFGARWMQLSIPWGVYGIHGTNNPASIGTRASHGCIRMYNRHVIELYSWVEVGTPVRLVGKPVRHWGELPRVIGAGICGTDVIRVQEALTELGLYNGPINGRYTSDTQRAIIALQKANNLPATGEVDQKTWHLLGY